MLWLGSKVSVVYYSAIYKYYNFFVLHFWSSSTDFFSRGDSPLSDENESRECTQSETAARPRVHLEEGGFTPKSRILSSIYRTRSYTKQGR